MKKLALAMILVLLALTPSGCWDRRELDNLSIMMAAGIDKAKTGGKIALTTQILKPAEARAPTGGMGGVGGGSPEAVWVTTSTGQTIFEAVRNFNFKIDRRPFWSHMRILIIGEDMARDGVAPLLDWFERYHESRRLIWVMVAKGEAKEVLAAGHEQEKIPAMAIERLLRNSNFTSMVPMVNLNDFLGMLASKGSEPFTAAIEVFEEKKEEGAEGQEEREKKEGEEKKEKKVKRVKTGGTAVFKKDKLIGWLDNTETRGLLWVLGKIKSGVIVVPAPEGSRDQKVSLKILRAESNLKPEIKDGKLIMNIEIKEESYLGEIMAPGNPATPEKFKLLEKEQAKVIEKDIRAALAKAQDGWGVDIFKFGEAVHRKYPKLWKTLEKQWDEEFPNVEVTIKVDSKVSRLGLTTKRVTSE